MALRRATTTPVTNVDDKFEDDFDSASATVTESVAATAAPAEGQEAPKQAPAQAPVASREVAPAPKREVTTAAVTADFTKQVEEMHNALDVSYGNFPLYKASSGGTIKCADDDKAPSLGRWAKVTMISWSKHYEIGPGSNDDDAKGYVAFSDNGKTIDRILGEELQDKVGTEINEYLKYLREEEGFRQAGCREFVDVACYVHENDAGADMTGKVIVLTLPPTSAMSFNRYQQQLAAQARAAKMGIPGVKVPEDPFTFYFITEGAKKGKNEWTKLVIESRLPSRF